MKYRLLFFLIILFAFILRLFRVSDTPHDLYMDEVSIGYNAYSILKTGRDEWGEKFPIYFKAYGEYKLPVYIYLTSVTQMIIGKNSLSVRLPSVILGTLTVGLVMILVQYLTTNGQKLMVNGQMSLVAGLMLAISPWHLHFSRAGFEANAGLFFFLLGIIFILFSCHSWCQPRNIFFKKGSLFITLGIIFLIISIYTYLVYRLFAPLFFLFLIFLYKKDFFAFLKEKKSRLGLILVMLLIIPLLFNIFSSAALKRVRTVSFLPQVRGTAEDLFYTPGYLSSIQFAKNYVSYFSFDFLFFTGDGNGRHGVREIGNIYLWQIPLVILGIYLSFKRKTQADKIFLSWIFLSPLAPAIVNPNPHSLRSLMMVIPITYFISSGLMSFLRLANQWERSIFYQKSTMKQWNHETIKQSTKFKHQLPIINHSIVFCLLFTVFCFYFLFHYLHIYYRHYPKRTSPDWSGGYRQAIEYITDQEENYNSIFISRNLESGYAFLYFYGQLNPEEILQSMDHTLGSGKYRFVSSPFNEKLEGKVLYLAPYWEKWPGRELSKIYNRGNDHVFTIWEN